jgi:hypothetical protein
MSTPQPNADVRVLAVSPDTADVLRVETKKVLMFNHEYFEDFLDFGPEAQYALSVIYRDAFAVIDTVGWDPNPDAEPGETIDVPLTFGHVDQLRRRRWDLGATNLDRLDDVPVGTPINPDLLAEITRDRLAAGALDRVIGTYEMTFRP